MYRVDRIRNRITPLSQKRFTEIGIRERDHLQEWLVHQADALGEELLIIQKEFDGFDETRERLDLLALDKEGNLVVIENKLDDSGRDVTWQALKYTAYVSGLKRGQIVDIFQQYLDRYCQGGSASNLLCEFLEVQELDEATLNPGNGQRIIFIAAHFRREVTATVLWLLSRGIRAQRFRVVPFCHEDELFVDLQQIIPPPEAADYMIGISSKEVEETATQETQRRRHLIRQEFWAQALEQLRADNVTIYANISPTRDHWLSAGSGLRACPYQMILNRNITQVQISLGRPDKQENKWLFERLFNQRDEIERIFGAQLEWRRMENNKQSRIVYSQAFEGQERENWPEMVSWLSKHMALLQAAFQRYLDELIVDIRTFSPEQNDNISVSDADIIG